MKKLLTTLCLAAGLQATAQTRHQGTIKLSTHPAPEEGCGSIWYSRDTAYWQKRMEEDRRIGLDSSYAEVLFSKSTLECIDTHDLNVICSLSKDTICVNAGKLKYIRIKGRVFKIVDILSTITP